MMAKHCREFVRGILAILLILWCATPQMLSADEGTTTPFQGVIGEFNPNSDTIVINEGPMKVTAETVFKNDKDKKIAKGGFTVGKWVYGVYQTTPNGRVIHKLFLLPGPVAAKDRARYPFMVQDEKDPVSGQE